MECAVITHAVARVLQTKPNPCRSDICYQNMESNPNGRNSAMYIITSIWDNQSDHQRNCKMAHYYSMNVYATVSAIYQLLEAM